jgi:hypothetical protein
MGPDNLAHLERASHHRQAVVGSPMKVAVEEVEEVEGCAAYSRLRLSFYKSVLMPQSLKRCDYVGTHICASLFMQIHII